METASQLIDMGYKPTVFERNDRLGGHVADWHRLFPDMTPAKDIVDPLVEKMERAELCLETHIDSVIKEKDTFEIHYNGNKTMKADAVVFTTGFNLFEAEKKEEYGYGIYDQVMTNKDLEHWFNTGEDSRIEGHEINAMGFVHCVGSRDIKAGNSQCSKVCCITAIKQAIEMKEKFPEAEIYCFYMDLRMFGKKYEDFYIRAQRDYGIHFIRGRLSEVSENINGRLIVKAEDTLSGKPLKVSLDLLVLMAGMNSCQHNSELAQMAGQATDTDGFLESRDNISGIIHGTKDGIYLAGACTGPKTVPETLAEARSAALSIASYLGGNDSKKIFGNLGLGRKHKKR